MALNRIVKMLYVIDILNYTMIDDSWGIGVANCNNYDNIDFFMAC
jgi:hypothetical protein